jgi:hypothetical protein
MADNRIRGSATLADGRFRGEACGPQELAPPKGRESSNH